MSRHCYVFRNGRFVELDLNAPLPPRKAPYIMSDIREYPSIITGQMITSRSEHRAHLREHGCIEVGNETPTLRPEQLPPAREDLRAALQASPETHAEARTAVVEADRALPGDLL